MNKEDFHIPFIKSLMVVAFVTIVALVSSHYAIHYYMSNIDFSEKEVNYSTHTSQIEMKR